MKKTKLYSILLFIVILIIWEAFVRIKDISQIILPTPSDIAMNLVQHFQIFLPSHYRNIH